MKSGQYWYRLNYSAAAHLEMGPKAEMLCRAATKGLPVPPGLVVRHEGWAERGQSISGARDSRWLANARAALFSLGFPSVGERVAVRSAFSAEDGADRSMAGHFGTVLHVEAMDTKAMAEALREVWLSAEPLAESDQPVARRDVLVMQMIAPEVSGVAFTERNFEDDLVNYTTGTAEDLVGGRESGHIVTLPKMRAWEIPDTRHRSEPWQRRLAEVLKGVRRVFGDGDWDVEWADDGQRCWLLQIRPVTAAPMRDELFTTANLKEILPEIPSPLMSSIIESNAFSIFGFYRRLDGGLPAGRPFFRLFAGRPYMNLSLLTDMMRRWGLPTSLVSKSLGGDEGLDLPHRPFRILRNAGVFLRLALMQLRAVGRARRELAILNHRASLEHETFGELFAASRESYRHLVQAMFMLISSAAGPVALLAKLGVLTAHQARHATVTTRMHRELSQLRELAAAHPHWQAQLQRGEAPEDPAFQNPWRRFLAVYGHRGVHETDLASPRWADAPDTLLPSLGRAPVARPEPPPLTWRARLTWPLWWWTRRLLAEREVIRNESMKGFAQLRRQWVEKAGHMGLQPEALWLLREEEILQLDAGWLPENRDTLNRQHQLDRFASIHLKDLVHAANPNAAIMDKDGAWLDGAEGAAPLAGRILVAGRADGQAWVLNEPAFELPGGFDPAATVLVARSVDAGWMATFGLVAGVVVEIGGDLSHGSILLRELGLPSLTNVPGATSRLHTGGVVELRADEGLVRLAA